MEHWFAMLLLLLTGNNFLWSGWLIAYSSISLIIWNTEACTRQKHLPKAIWMLYGEGVPRDLAELLTLARVGPKIAILTLEFGYNEYAISSIELSSIV